MPTVPGDGQADGFEISWVEPDGG
ncbi:MAG: hypothetical protein QOF44_101, partial [Streptomyces sp.]|nr:hypothetical protein [Streptomyces sp.]